MTEQEVEAVARAICGASPVFKSGWDEQTPVEKAIWKNVARAAIAALDTVRDSKRPDDLAARLRRTVQTASPRPARRGLHEAADTIDRLTRELAAARSAPGCDCDSDAVCAAFERAEKAEAEVARLREAGQAFLDAYKAHGTGEAPTFGLLHIKQKREAFRAALAGEDGG